MLVDRKSLQWKYLHLDDKFPKFIHFLCFGLAFVVLAMLDIWVDDVPVFLISLLLLLHNAVECIIGILAKEVKASN